jgi:hypothetical protein
MTFPPGLRALNHPEYRRLYLTQLVAQVGGWIQAVAQSWLVLQLTGSPLKLGLISTLQFAPVLLFSIIAGAEILPLAAVRPIAARTIIAVEALRTIAGVAVAIPAKRAIAARTRRIAEIPARRTITVAVALAGEGFASAGMGFLVVGSRSVGFPG